jgi:hypothetical protein
MLFDWMLCGLDVRSWVYRVYAGEKDEMLLEMSVFRVGGNPYEDLTEGYYVLNTNISNAQVDHDKTNRFRQSVNIDRLLEESGSDLFISTLGEHEINSIAEFVNGTISVNPFPGLILTVMVRMDILSEWRIMTTKAKAEI